MFEPEFHHYWWSFWRHIPTHDIWPSVDQGIWGKSRDSSSFSKTPKKGSSVDSGFFIIFGFRSIEGLFGKYTEKHSHRKIHLLKCTHLWISGTFPPIPKTTDSGILGLWDSHRFPISPIFSYLYSKTSDFGQYSSIFDEFHYNIYSRLIYIIYLISRNH